MTFEHPARMHSGIYFGLDEDRYHDVFALSAHGVGLLRVSSMDYWVFTPALNPGYADLFSSREESEARIVGRAYHARIIEGPGKFSERFAAGLDRADYPGALDTVDQMKAYASAGGMPTKGMSGAKKADWVALIVKYDPTVLIWETLQRGHQAKHEGKTMLEAKTINRIEIAAKMIEADPQLSKAFSGGMPEVSVFWEDARTGVPCKARIDYLKWRAMVELKSYANPMNRPVRQAIVGTIERYGYYRNADFYLQAGAAARQLARDGLVFGDVDPEYIRHLSGDYQFEYLFVFQKKGPAPVARGHRLHNQHPSLYVARAEIEDAKDTFVRCWEHYGIDPWLDVEEITDFDDEEINVTYTERRK